MIPDAVSTVRPVVANPSKTVKDDFKKYWNGAEKSRLEDEGKQKSTIATAHRFSVAFSFLARAMAVDRALAPHQSVFFQELASDAVHLVHVLLNGDARAGRFYLRSIIENFWRHHYFRDHVIEYGWLHSRNKYYLEMRELREHCGFLPCFASPLDVEFKELPRLYALLSTSVHSTDSRSLVLRKSLEEIKLLRLQSESLVRDMRQVMQNCLLLCIYSERNTFSALHKQTQDFIFELLPKAKREKIKALVTEIDPAEPPEPP
ncbi:hypothetical protein, partial [Pseudacidovorax intermedius]|uniref:hypothetical protein n=1 Tax=Pseudacidovorax intermedius TaxID=433924 RepID=UPI00128EE353